MKYELKKTESPMFSEYYTGYNPQTNQTVHCILDDNCVRFVVVQCDGPRTKVVKRREYSNQNKARCMANATAALNR